MRIYTRGKSILALTLVLLTLVMLVPLRQANAVIPTATIPVKITWSGTADNSLLPASLPVSLTQSGPNGVVANYRKATLTKTDAVTTAWTGSFTDVPETTISGIKYSYSVVWPGAKDFTIVASSSNVAYNGEARAQYVYKTASLPTQYTVNLAWSGEPTGHSHPDVNVQLINVKAGDTNNPIHTFKNGEPVNHVFNNTTIIKAGDPVSVSVTPPAGYIVTSEFDGDHTFTITLKYNSDFSGTITWLNAPRFNKPSVTIAIGPEGGAASNTLIVDARTDEDVLSYSIPVSNPDLTYVIKSVTIRKDMADDNNYAAPTWNGHNISIVRTTDPLFRIGVNMRWIDNNNKRERRPNETTIYLYRDGAYTGDAVQISEASGWYAIFYDQPYSTGSHVFKYSVRAHKIPYYWSRTTRLSNYGFLLTQFYGTKSSGKTTTSSAAPKVGDPTLFRTELTDLMRREAVSSALTAAALAGATENAEATEPTAVDFETLKRINKDVVAWLSLADTTIDYPILRGSNNTKYLTRLWSGEANSAGSIFMDYHNNGKFANKNTIVYGHNMQNGTMFNALLSYRNQSFYEAHKSISLQTPSGDYSLEPVAGFFTKETYTNVAKRTFNNNAAFLSYVDKCIDNSDFQSEATVTATDKLVTLVTCSNDYNDGTRYLLVCKLTALD